MTKELLTCPFTGEKPEVTEWAPKDGQHKDYGGGVFIVFIKSPLVEVAGSSFNSMDEARKRAIRLWHTRKEPKSAPSGYEQALQRIVNEPDVKGKFNPAYDNCVSIAKQALAKAHP